MIIPDVNVWVSALRSDAVDHDRYRAWLSAALSAKEPVGISELMLSGVVRVLTNPRIFRAPSPTDAVLASLAALRSAPGTQIVRPGEQHWSIFVELCRATEATGNSVPDAYHAALAIESGSTFATTDRGFVAFPGLAIIGPLEA